MYKKTVTYTDFDGNERTEDLYFNFSRAELIELEYSHPGGMSNYLENIVNTHDTASIMANFKEIILGAYGVKSPDGKRFIKNQTIREEFEESPAYDEILITLISDTDEMTKFINSIIPSAPILKSAAGGAAKPISLKEAARNVLDQKQNS